MKTISLTINDKPVTASVEPRTHLADFLRESRNLTGTHIGCEHGVCGACTLLVDGVPVRSCITYAVACDGANVTTVEGLDNDEITAELRKAFSQEHALQCGYCTPGMLASARDLVIRLDGPDEQAIRYAMSGNLCRCTGYVGIVKAVQNVIRDRRARGIAPEKNGGRTACGPVGSDRLQTDDVTAVKPRATQASVTRAPQSRTRTAFDPNWKPQSSFEQSFTVDHPRDVVWDFFGRTEEVARCLPGASITDASSSDHVEGQIRVKVGPIAADFHGVADIERDDRNLTGRIAGSGRDARSNSATRGEVRYKLIALDGGARTRVDLSVGYTLTGVLAQFSRGGLVQDIANRLTAAFAQNLEARLSGHGETTQGAELHAGALVFSVIWQRIKKLLRLP